VVVVPEEELEDEAAVCQYATKALVPSYSELTARHPPSLPSPAFPRQPPKEATPRSSRSRPHREKGHAADAAATDTALGRRVRHLVGPVILSPATLVVAAAVLLVTLARGRFFVIGGVLHTALQSSPEVAKDLDGEEAILHYFEVENAPRH